MHQMVRTLREIARHETAQRTASALGVVKSVQGGGPDDYSCTVELRETGMVLPRVPIVAGFMGFATLPAEDDLVIVLFLAGDFHAPVIAGRLYTQQLAAPKHEPGELVVMLPPTAKEDECAELRVKTPGDGTRKLSLTLAGDVPVSITTGDDGIVLKTGDVSIELKQTSASDGALTITVGKASIKMEQAGDISVETSGKLTLKGQSVEISGDTSVKVAGQTIDLN
jgi:uncharacterized protein involved in type VI secretion and phage assembly